METGKENKKELLIYLGILAVLIVVIICNNVFWKLGKQQEDSNQNNNATYFESDNIIYDVPFEEEWLD